MNVHFTARQTDLTPEVRQYCEKRLKALEKLLGSVLEVDIILSVAKTRQRAEIHVKDKGAGLVVVEETPDMMNSLNLAFDGLETKIRKEREKFRERKRRKGRERKDLALPAEAEEPERRILRSPHLLAQAHVRRGGRAPARHEEPGGLRVPQGGLREMGRPLPAQGRPHRPGRARMTGVNGNDA